MPAPPFSLNPGSEHGTTLMEMLVAVLTSIVVLGALLAILEFSLKQEAAIADRVSSDRLARLTMSKVVQDLQSSCTGFGATAIQAPSTTPVAPLKPTGSVNLWLLSAFGNKNAEAAVLASVTEHDINWTETGKSKTGATLGTLTDYAFASESGESPNWVFPQLKIANAKTTVLAKNVIPPKSGSVFRYFRYTAGTGTFPETPLTATETETAAAAKQIAKVTVSFTQASENADTLEGRTTNISDSVVLRFNSAQPGTEIGTSPCE